MVISSDRLCLPSFLLLAGGIAVGGAMVAAGRGIGGGLLGRRADTPAVTAMAPVSETMCYRKHGQLVWYLRGLGKGIGQTVRGIRFRSGERSSRSAFTVGDRGRRAAACTSHRIHSNHGRYIRLKQQQRLALCLFSLAPSHFSARSVGEDNMVLPCFGHRW